MVAPDAKDCPGSGPEPSEALPTPVAGLREHNYAVTVTWTGNIGVGTADYGSYRRDHEVNAVGKPVLPGSADPRFRGDAGRYNPEELLVASLSACHLLWYLHVCADAGIVVVAYRDDAAATLSENADGGEITSATLRPKVSVSEQAMVAPAIRMHADAHERCFIARSVRFSVLVEPIVEVESVD
jgi:organic hydroperoxide reductase OsmC/OhrA